MFSPVILVHWREGCGTCCVRSCLGRSCLGEGNGVDYILLRGRCGAGYILSRSFLGGGGKGHDLMFMRGYLVY